MAEYVDKKHIYGLFSNTSGVIRLHVAEVDNLTAADVGPVVHARWEYHDCVCTGEGLAAVYACSNCRFCIDEEVFEQLNATDFCNCCGARMDGE